MSSEVAYELLDAEGHSRGWVSATTARFMRGRGLSPPMVVEPPQRWLDDPYVAFVAQLVNDQGLLQGDMSPIRQWALRGIVLRREKRRYEDQEAILLAQMSFTAPEAYLELRERREQEKLAKEEAGIEWRSPQTPEELAEVMEELREIFGDEGLEGWDEDGDDDWEPPSPSFEGPDYGDFYEGMS